MYIKGQIERIASFDGKFGPMYSIFVDGERYGSGKGTQGAKEGDWVEFSATKNGKGYWDVDKGSLKPIEAPEGKSVPAPATAVASSKVNYVDARQDSIVFQSSRKDALHFIDIAVGAGLVDFGKSKGAERLAILETYVDKYTEHFIDECKKGVVYSSQDAPSPAEEGASFDDDQIPF